MKKFNTLITMLFAGICLAGCLVTRQEVRETVQKPSPEQRERADTRARYNELEEQMRSMLGKIEYLERGLNNLAVERSSTNDQEEKDRMGLKERMKIYEETLTRMESQFLLMSQKIEALQAAQAKSASSSAASSSSKKNSFDQAEEEFSKKSWKQAIVAYEKYRELNPKGKNYAEATYKIGLSFQELGMSNEGKVFLNEVIEKYPKSEFAKKASTRLKNSK